MPTYGYECNRCKEQFEQFQRISDEPLKVHEGCGGELRRLLYPVGIVFKGSGFYVNDYARKSSSAPDKADSSAAGEKTDGSPAESKADSSGAGPEPAAPRAEAKPESKPEVKASP